MVAGGFPGTLPESLGTFFFSGSPAQTDDVFFTSLQAEGVLLFASHLNYRKCELQKVIAEKYGQAGRFPLDNATLLC